MIDAYRLDALLLMGVEIADDSFKRQLSCIAVQSDFVTQLIAFLKVPFNAHRSIAVM